MVEEKDSWKEGEAQKEASLFQDRFPAVVTTDDLIMEIGKQAVRIVNLEKLLNQLLQTKQKTETVTEEVRKKLTALEKSNKAYVEANQRLDIELMKVREANVILEREIAEAKKPKKRIRKKK